MPSVPPGHRVYAVGDVHGELDLLLRLLARIKQNALTRGPAAVQKLIFLGDYIDRGPQSRQVVDLLCEGLPDGFEPVFLEGNHEQMMKRAIEARADLDLIQLWLQNGGVPTLASYGVDRETVMDSLVRRNRLVQGFLPPAHERFYGSLALSETVGDYLFVHAGVRPGVPLDRQSAADLMWIREPFLSYGGDLGKVVVHGHTPSDEPVVRRNRIGIDTGAFASGQLTAVMLEGSERELITVG